MKQKKRLYRITPQMRKFAEHFAIENDRDAAILHAYPLSPEWKHVTRRSLACRMMQHPLIMTLVAEIRMPVLKDMQIDFAWKVREALRHYYALTRAGNSTDALKALRLIDDLTEGDLRPPLSPADRKYDPSEIEDGELVEIAGAVLGVPALTQGDNSPAAFGSAALPEQFCELLRRTPAGDTSPGTLHGAPDGDPGADHASDGVHATGSGEIDILKRLRAKLGARESARNKPDLGEPHSSTE